MPRFLGPQNENPEQVPFLRRRERLPREHKSLFGVQNAKSGKGEAMKNLEVALIETRSLSELETQRKKLIEFVRTQLVDGVDFGLIPGTKRPSLFKPGAEKLAKLFQLGATIVDKGKELNFQDKFAYYSYTIEISHLPSQKIVSQCEGSANSQEKKYRAQTLGDILNTLQKMAQKRAYVGAIIQAVGASDLYTQDTEDIHLHHAERPVDDRRYSRSEPDGEVRKSEVELPYRITFGKYRGKGLNEVTPTALSNYCQYLLDASARDGLNREQLSEVVQDFLNRAEAFLEGE